MNQARLASVIPLALLTQPLLSQNPLGPWDGFTNPSIPTILYVDAVTGSNFNSGGTPGSPLQSITFALGLAASITPVVPVTINVLPGIYDATSETFPLVVPAEGVALEALGDGVILDAGGANQNVIEVRGTRSGALPEAVIQNFLITNGLNGVVLDETLGGAGATVPSWRQETRVRFCEIVSNDNAGILIRTAADEDGNSFRSEHLIERNQISENPVGIVITSDGGYDASMIRCNEIFGNGTNVAMNVVVSPTIQDPLDRLFVRLCSNMIYGGGIVSVQISGGTTFMVNNTVADSAIGLQINANSTVDVTNTILWNPGGIDLQVSPVGVATVFRHCDFQSAASLALANSFPGSAFNVSINPLFVGFNDYRLTADSPLIDQGDHTRVDPATAGEAIVAQDPTWVVPLAPGLDFDWEPRILYMQGRTSPNLVSVQPNPADGTWCVDIGADEVNHANFLALQPPGNFGTTSLTVTSNIPAALDRAGSVRNGLNPTLTFVVAGQVGGAAVLMFWHTYAPYPNPNAQVLLEDYHNVYLPQIGSLLIDATLPAYFLQVSGNIGPGGLMSVSVPVSGLGFPADFEGEFRVQAMTVELGTSLRFDMTNVLRLELDR
jgi:hypothetical protein